MTANSRESERFFAQMRAAAALCAMLALTLPLLLLHGFPPVFQVEPGLRVAHPFGWPELAAVHVIFTLPFAFLISQVVAPRMATWLLARGWTRFVSLAAWASFFAIGFALRNQYPPVLNEGEFLARHFDRCLRTLWLELPWCLAALILWRAGSAEPNCAAPTWRSCVWLVIAIVSAWGIPFQYACRLEQRAIVAIVWYQEQGRVGQTWRSAAALGSVGSSLTPQGDLLPIVFRDVVRHQYASHSVRVQHPLPEWATDEQRIQYAVSLAALDMFEPALATLAPLVPQNSEASKWSAAIESSALHPIPVERPVDVGLVRGRGAAK